jgi:hypothetical protein
MSRTCAVVLALGLGAGCGTPARPGGGSAAPPPPPPARPRPAAPAADTNGLEQDYPRLADRAVTLYEAVADAFRAAGEDCAQATRRLDAIAAANRDVVAANVKVLHDGHARELKQALAARGDQLDAAARAIVESPTMAKCSQDPAFTRSFDDLVGTPP